MKRIFTIILIAFLVSSIASASTKCDVKNTNSTVTITHLPYSIEIIDNDGQKDLIANTLTCAGRTLQKCSYSEMPTNTRSSLRCEDSQGHIIYQTYRYHKDTSTVWFTCNDLSAGVIYYSNLDLINCKFQ